MHLRARLVLWAAEHIAALIQVVTDQNSHIPFFRAALQLLIRKSVQIARIAPSEVQSLALALLKLGMAADHSAL